MLRTSVKHALSALGRGVAIACFSLVRVPTKRASEKTHEKNPKRLTELRRRGAEANNNSNIAGVNENRDNKFNF